MPIVPLRELGKLGVVTDVDSFDLPINSFSFAKNVRFEDNKVERGCVFRKVYDLTANPRHLVAYDDQTGVGHTVVVDENGHLWEYASNGTATSVNPTGATDVLSVDAPITSTVMQNIVYVNRPDRLPAYKSRDGSGAFTVIPTGTTSADWHADWRCRVLRGAYGVLMAFNVDKGASHYGNLVKWSDFSTEPNMLPPNWDFASTTSNAGENTLAEMVGEIVDAQLLRNVVFVYGDHETWRVDFVGGSNMFSFTRAYDRNVINVNCVAEVNGVAYCFGEDDIWLHDGTQDHSLASGAVRKFVYQSLKKDQAHFNFVSFNRRTNEVVFCYVSDDPYCKFSAANGQGCNRAVIYNVLSKVFYFADLPYVTAAALLRPTAIGASFDSMGVSYEDVGGSFAAQAVETKLNVVFAGYASGAVTRSLRTFEPFREAAAAFNLDIPANGEALLFREGIDCDELGAELRGYKLISSIYPQGRLDSDAMPIIFEFGTYDLAEDAPSYGVPQTWDRTYYKLDYNLAGRYLAFRITQQDLRPFSFSGFDFDVTILGRF